MRKWLQKIEKMAAAVAFAEEGEWRMATSILQESDDKRSAREIDKKSQRKTRLRGRSYRA
ncbi:MAG: hypothetical protein ACP5VS_11570 [Desulfomonilaceae bacterium]